MTLSMYFLLQKRLACGEPPPTSNSIHDLSSTCLVLFFAVVLPGNTLLLSHSKHRASSVIFVRVVAGRLRSTIAGSLLLRLANTSFVVLVRTFALSSKLPCVVVEVASKLLEKTPTRRALEPQNGLLAKAYQLAPQGKNVGVC